MGSETKGSLSHGATEFNTAADLSQAACSVPYPGRGRAMGEIKSFFPELWHRWKTPPDFCCGGEASAT